MTVPYPSTRLTREEFRALAKAKGWKFTMLAARWGVTPEWISNVCRDPQRDVRYDDALHGLPDLQHLKRDLRQRAREVALAVAKRQAQSVGRSAGIPGHRYRGYLVVGAVVTLAIAYGSLADEGQRGIVFQVVHGTKEENYGVLFESGAHDWFGPDAVDHYLVATGLNAAGAATYAFDSAAVLRADFDNGVFDFWPQPAHA